MTQLIKLADKAPVAVGKKRKIYEHPFHKEWLIKVYKNNSKKPKFFLNKYFVSMHHHHSYLSGFVRELREYVRSRYLKECSIIPHMQTIIGFAETDMGLGMVVLALRDAEGNLAPTLKQLIKQKKLTPELKVMLNSFFTLLLHVELAVGDLNWKNIVLAYDHEDGERFFLVDGLGDKTFLPLHRMFKPVRRHYIKKRIAKLRNNIDKELP